MAPSTPLAKPTLRSPQFGLWCRACGEAGRLVRSLCPACYAAERHDRLHFGGLRARVLDKARRRCQVCGASGEGKRKIHVHHRRPGASRERYLVALCPAHHAQVHKLQVLDRLLPPLARELWRDLHPAAPEQLPLGFAPAAVANEQAWLWETSRAG